MADLRVRKGDVLPPYNPYSVCPKCLGEDVATQHVPGCALDGCRPEHMVRQCRRCRYAWPEGVLG